MNGDTLSKNVCHNDEMEFRSSMSLHHMEPIETDNKCVGISHDVLVDSK